MKTTTIIFVLVGFGVLSSSVYAESKTYYVYVGEMPKPWEEKFGHVWDEAITYWEKRMPEIKFIEVPHKEFSHFNVQWASEYLYGTLGYFGPDKWGRYNMAVTLGFFDDDGKWQLVSQEYALEITKHELGHVLGLEHSDDPSDIMYPSIENYDEWKKLQELIKEKNEEKIAVNQTKSESPETNSDIIPPKKQLEMNIPVDKVLCKKDLKLILKNSDKSPACVRPETVKKLIERGWAQIT